MNEKKFNLTLTKNDVRIIRDILEAEVVCNNEESQEDYADAKRLYELFERLAMTG